MTEENKTRYYKGASTRSDIQSLLQDKDFQRLIKGSVGAFSIRFLFLNTYANYAHRLEIDPCFSPSAYPSKGLSFRDILLQIRKMISPERVRPVDVLFVSINRQVKARTRSGCLEGNYIFYSIINELEKKHPYISQRMFVFDENIYDQYYQADMLDLFKCIYISLEKFIQWIFLRKGIAYRLGENKCRSVMASADQFFRPRFLFRSVLMSYSINRMLERVNPKVIVCNDDWLYTKPLGQSDAKVIVLQSSRMAEDLEETRKVILQEDDIRPDYFLASGDYFKELKLNGRAADQVIATGLPRYDLLGYASEIYSRPDFIHRHGIDPVDKIVLWSTQSHSLSKEENVANIRAIFGALKESQDITLVIKQHPAEPLIYSEMYRKQIEEDSGKTILVPQDSDTYELLFICDLMITKNSTTAMEAIALNKPVIVLNLSDQPDLVEYVREGVALGITDEGLLNGAIRRLLKDDHELATNRKRYVEKYLCRIDGKATPRVVKIILNCLEKAKIT